MIQKLLGMLLGKAGSGAQAVSSREIRKAVDPGTLSSLARRVFGESRDAAHRAT